MLTLLSFAAANFLYLILYITNGSFPKPLTPSEEKLYLSRFADGDVQARGILIEHNLRLVAHIIKKYYANTSSSDQDDLISIGTIGLIKGIDTFNIEKGAKLVTYISRCIENEILMYFRSIKKNSSDVSLDDKIETEKDGKSVTLIDIIHIEDTIAEDIDLKIKSMQLRECINKYLHGRERTIIELRYGLNDRPPLTQREVSNKLKISRSYVSRLEKKALSSLRDKLETCNK